MSDPFIQNEHVMENCQEILTLTSWRNVKPAGRRKPGLGNLGGFLGKRYEEISGGSPPKFNYRASQNPPKTQSLVPPSNWFYIPPTG
jgi:hypothetical protein